MELAHNNIKLGNIVYSETGNKIDPNKIHIDFGRAGHGWFQK